MRMSTSGSMTITTVLESPAASGLFVDTDSASSASSRAWPDGQSALRGRAFPEVFPASRRRRDCHPPAVHALTPAGPGAADRRDLIAGSVRGFIARGCVYAWDLHVLGP